MILQSTRSKGKKFKNEGEKETDTVIISRISIIFLAAE